jgi:hypothetical protein
VVAKFLHVTVIAIPSNDNNNISTNAPTMLELVVRSLEPISLPSP